MQLTVPQRTVADTGSFPVDPAGVNQWLAALNPLQSIDDAREVYRGLRHSNRLHNDIDRRRSVIACFIPTLRDLHASLLEICQAQPLPLTLEFQRNSQLLDGLLREEAFAFKILLADSEQARSDDLRRAMQALARQAEACLHGYKRVPEALMLDAHQLYVLAKAESLDTNPPSDELFGTEDHYRYLLLQSLVDAKQHRAKQIQLLLDFLRDNANRLFLGKKAPIGKLSVYDFALNANHGARPMPAASIVDTHSSNILWLNISEIIDTIDQLISQSRASSTMLLATESLERQSLVRLRVDLAQSRKRRSARKIVFEPHQVFIGHKAICSQLQFEAMQQAKQKATEGERMAELDNLHSKLLEENEPEEPWVITNETSLGVALYNADCRAGLVQVGDLVSINSNAASAMLNPHVKSFGKSTATLGIVRWLTAGKARDIKMGVEYLARGILPVGIVRTDSEDSIDTDALIVACKVKNTVLQTMLLPAYLYQPGDRLTVKLNGKTRKLQLHQTLQSNGLFSHYSLKDA